MAKGPYPSDKQDQYMVRFPDGMRDHLKEAAAKNKRSLNAEIIGRLEAYDAIRAQMIEMHGEKDRLEGKLAALRAADTTGGLLRILEDVTERLERIEQKIDY